VINPLLFSALVAQPFAEFAHLAPKPRSKEAGAVGVPLVVVAEANPMAVAAVNADVDRALFGAFVIAAGVFFHGSRLGLRAEGTRRARSTRGVVQCLDNGKTAERNSAVPAMQSSLGMRMDNSLLETSTAACVRLRCREPQVLHACFRFSSNELAGNSPGCPLIHVFSATGTPGYFSSDNGNSARLAN
jgi:hypothetical protein